jgi:hypothetical protein
MIVEITNDEIDRALKKRTSNEDTSIPTQIKGRPRKIWLIQLGYSNIINADYPDAPEKQATKVATIMWQWLHSMEKNGMVAGCLPNPGLWSSILAVYISQSHRWSPWKGGGGGG